ncbi:MAG: RnfH family protein [Burkholderiales bacterium]|nr:RnfH family protein [Burkholderiales bacterium]
MDRVEAEGTAAATIRVEVVYAPAPHRIDLSEVELSQGATVEDALRASGVLERHRLDPTALALGIWGRGCPKGQQLRDRDRVEIYRSLQVAPKEARRLRDQAQAGKRKGGRGRGAVARAGCAEPLSGSRSR